VSQWELDLGVLKKQKIMSLMSVGYKQSTLGSYMELQGGGALAVLRGYHSGLDDLNRPVARSVTTSHIVIYRATQTKQ
jgi:hypothetical protein